MEWAMRSETSRRLTVSVASLVGVAMVVISGSGTGASVPPAVIAPTVAAVPGEMLSVGSPADSRSEMISLLAELDRSIAGMRRDPLLAAALENGPGDLRSTLAEAVELVGAMDQADLVMMEEALDTIPALEQLPGAIDAAVEEALANAATAPVSSFAPRVRDRTITALDTDPVSVMRSTPTISSMAMSPTMPILLAPNSPKYTDNCASAGDAKRLVYATFVANQVQSAAYAVVIAVPSAIALLPSVSSPNPAKVVVAIIYGIALAVYLSLALTLAVAEDCAGTVAGAIFELGLPVGPDGTVVRGSSQISVDIAIASAGGVGDLVDDISEGVDDLGLRLEEIADAVATLNLTLSCETGFEPPPDPADGEVVISPAAVVSPGCESDEVGAVARTESVNEDAQELQADVTVLIETERRILVQADTEVADLADFRALQLRMEIEANLGQNGLMPIASFQLPPPAGHLDLVKAIVTETVVLRGANTRDLLLADWAFADGRFKQAYTLYQRAYQGAVR
jgi:hypothetical protein